MGTDSILTHWDLTLEELTTAVYSNPSLRECFLATWQRLWRFVFAKNDDLPRSTYGKYTKAQRSVLLASLIPVSWPPEPPFYAEPYKLLDEISQERKRKKVKPMIVADAEQIMLLG